MMEVLSYYIFLILYYQRCEAKIPIFCSFKPTVV